MENKSEPLSVPQFQEDRISKLPDDILVDILSKLKFKEAGQTSVLSHRWLNLWTHVPWLHLGLAAGQHPRTPKQKKQDMRVFVNGVNHVLDSLKSPYLREFKIIHELDKSYQNEIDKWLEYAFGARVERLELNLGRYGYPILPIRDRYNFPSQLLHHQTTKLGLQLAPKFDFSCLRELCFLCVNISGEAIECLLLKCPMLEDLRVIGSAVLVNVVVSGPSLMLKHLEINCCLHVDSLKISDTNIVFLKLYLVKNIRLLLNNLPMFTEVWIKGDFPNKCILSSQLSCCLSQLTVLTIQALEPKTIMELYKFPELQKLRRLVLVANICEYKNLIGLTSLIDSCPHLVEFALMLHPAIDGSCEMQEKAKGQPLKGLKVFELYGYHGNYEYEEELIMFFIENAVALVKIVIDPCKIDTRHGYGTLEDKRTKKSRTHAAEKYKGLVPKQVELVVL